VNTSARAVVVNGLNRPLFHIDLTGALQSAIANVQARDEFEGKGGAGIGEIP
jgi:solute carrier family 26 (sodium-independent sulfate anion transporter), member 11